MSTQTRRGVGRWREQLAEATSGPDIVTRMTAAQNHVTVNGRHQYSVLQNDGTWADWPSVTQIVGVLDKPALVHWAAREQMAADIETAWQLACAPPAQLAGVTGAERRAAFEAAFHQAAGDVKAHRKASAKAADLGTQVHALIEHALATQLGLADAEAPPAASDQVLYVFAGFEEWAREVKLEPLCLEARLFSHRWSYAGTLDFLGLVEGKLTVIDWKASKAIYAEMRLQSIGYRMAVAEMLGIPPPAGTIVRLPKGDDQGAIEVKPLDDDPDATFRAFLALREAHCWLRDDKKGG